MRKPNSNKGIWCWLEIVSPRLRVDSDYTFFPATFSTEVQCTKRGASPGKNKLGCNGRDGTREFLSVVEDERKHMLREDGTEKCIGETS